MQIADEFIHHEGGAITPEKWLSTHCLPRMGRGSEGKGYQVNLLADIEFEQFPDGAERSDDVYIQILKYEGQST